MLHKSFRPLFVLVLVAVQMFAGISPALAAPPVNDNFADATTVGTIPFSHSADNTEASLEADEPQWCSFISNTVWYKFIPLTSGTMRIDMAGTAFPDTMLNSYRDNGNGIGNLSFLGCTFDFGDTGYRTLDVQAGVTYYFQAGSYNGGSGELHFNMQMLPPPPNDNFADAAPISSSVPSDVFGDLFTATLEAGEQKPSCAYFTSGPTKTVWYSWIPSSSGTISAWIPSSSFIPVLTAYTGNSLGSLTELRCQTYSSLLTLEVNAGTTYYFQVGNLFSWEEGGQFQLRLDAPPPPQAGFYYSPAPPTRIDVHFQSTSDDPAALGIETYTWDFGDGTGSSGSAVSHTYAMDGDYLVTHTVTTFDDRTASTTQTVEVRTHDVAISKLITPNSASVGQTKLISVGLRNNAYPEMVQVDLYKGTSSGYTWVATVTKSVPVLTASRTTAFNFNYTFTSDDARIGKVTFKAIATIVGTSDALPADNELTSSPPTKVAR